MANRPYFIIGNGTTEFYIEKNCEFKFYTGFALAQKQKSVKSLHEEIQKANPKSKILEVSRRSENPLGIQLSAFNLQYKYSDGKSYPVECVFQSSKVFESGDKYDGLLYVTPREAKTDDRIRNSGKLKKFSLDGVDWELEPKTMFYDYIYISALANDKNLCEQLMGFNTFTDIEFNPQKSFNCQARSVAIAVTLLKYNLLEKYINDKELFKTIYPSLYIESQLNLFSL